MTSSDPTSSGAVLATVLKELPQGLYELRTEHGRHMRAGPSEKARRLGVDIHPGQRVWVRPARLDPGRGVILASAQ